MNEKVFKKKLCRLLALACCSVSLPVLASDFSLPFVNASDLGTAYSGWAAIAEDASTAYTNPAGLTCIHNYQLVFPVLGLYGDTEFLGATKAPTFPFELPTKHYGSASSKLEALFPSFYFAAPITDRLTFGFSQTAPFGLGTEYPDGSIVRYLATKSKIVVIDAGPSLGFKVNNRLSIGAGFDAQYLMFTLNHMYGPPFSIPLDSENKNDEHGWGFGWHGGILYQLCDCARLGLSYNSRTYFSSKGISRLYIPTPFTVLENDKLRTHAALPERAQLSVLVDLNPAWSLMSTLYYIHWSILNKIVLENTAFFDGPFNVTIPFNYRDTLDLSVGVAYRPNRCWTLRTGFQIMDSPTNNRQRGVADPIGKGLIAAVGAKYQQNCHLSYDIGYGHSFFRDQTVDAISPIASATGFMKSQSNLLGIQINWNI